MYLNLLILPQYAESSRIQEKYLCIRNEKQDQLYNCFVNITNKI